MIIYRDITSPNKDEIISDAFAIKDVGDGLWEIDLSMVTKGGDSFVLEGANASAEGEDADEGDDVVVEKVLDIVHMFRLNKVEGLTKKEYTGELKKYMKKVTDTLKANGKSEADIKDFQDGAKKAAPKILANFKDYDIYAGESYDPIAPAMYVLVNYREDGITPYATIWKHGLEEYKV